MSDLRDSPRPDGYWPGTPSQWREPTVDDCTWYAVEFAFEAASETHRSVHPVKELRAFSSDTVGGTPVHVAIREASRLWPADQRVYAEYGSYTRKQIGRLLAAGAVLVYGGDYEKLPLHYRRWTNNDTFDHAMASKDLLYTGGIFKTFLYDPLGGGPTYQPYDGEWIDINALLGFTWQDGPDRYWLGVVENEGEYPVRTLNVSSQYPADKEVRVRNGTAVRAQPRETGERTRGFYNEDTWRPIIGSAGGGWLLTAWSLDQSRANIGYVSKEDVLEWRTVAPPVPASDPEMVNELARYKEAVTLVREATSTLP